MSSETSNGFRFNEKYLSQIPALQQLISLGFEYLTPGKALAERQDKAGNILLERILRKQPKAINRIQYKCNVNQQEVADHHNRCPGDEGVEALAMTLPQSQQLFGIAKIDFNGPAAGIVIDDLHTRQYRFR